MNLYAYPTTLSDALAVLSDNPDAVIVGGGTMVIPKLSTGELRPDALLDVSRIPELTQVRTDTTGHWILGAAVTYQQIVAATELPFLLRTAAAGVTGGPQILAQGTIGGSASYANPSSDMPSVLVALDATMVVDGVHGRRHLPADTFFEDAFTTAITHEPMILCEIRIPATRATAPSGYCKLRIAESSWPIVTAASTVLNPFATKYARECRVTVGGASGKPFSFTIFHEPSLPLLRHIIDDAAPTWNDDALATAAYRRRVTPVIVRRSIRQSLERMEDLAQS
ncbi:FAD binding domain-containing protein [Nocardia sp. NPDC004750]